MSGVVWLNLILLNLLWFTSVLGAANELLWPAAWCLLLLLATMFIYQGLTKKEMKIIGFSLLFGIVLDGFLYHSGWLTYASPYFATKPLPPIWILFLWAGFGASIMTGMRWMINKPALGASVMAIGAPLSYVSAAKLGAVTVNNYPHALLLIGAAWFLYFCCIRLLVVKKHHPGVEKNVVVQ